MMVHIFHAEGSKGIKVGQGACVNPLCDLRCRRAKRREREKRIRALAMAQMISSTSTQGSPRENTPIVEEKPKIVTTPE